MDFLFNLWYDFNIICFIIPTVHIAIQEDPHIMERLGLNEIRRRFLDFYASKDHYVGKSASLIPQNDKSILIINSGMAPLKAYFAGTETPPKEADVYLSEMHSYRRYR